MRCRCAPLLRACVLAHRPAALAASLLLLPAGCASDRAPERHVVEMSAFAFNPDTVHAAAGDTVVWINRDVVPHTATAGNGAWDSRAVTAQGSWSFVAGDTGSTSYLCTLHPSMTGVIVVAEEE